MQIFLIALFISFITFMIIYKCNKASTISGFFFALFLILFLITSWICLHYIGGTIQIVMTFVIAIPIILIVLFGSYIIIGYFLINARIVFKHEKRTLSNSLTLILAFLLIAFWVTSLIINNIYDSVSWITIIWDGLSWPIIFYFYHVLVFLLSNVLCNLARPRKNQDYIIVLGSGLVDGKVTPLLASRINKAIDFAENQKKSSEKTPKLIMSGGKGDDEPIAESISMKEYAVEHGFDQKLILTETKSTNTFENMKFSKQIIEEDAKGTPFACIYATSNYHMLRAGIYAKKAGLKIDGIGAKTARYFLPNALLREYIAYLALHKKKFLIISICLFILRVILSIADIYIINNFLG